VIGVLDQYREHLEHWNFAGHDMSVYGRPVLSRYHTFKKAFEMFVALGEKQLLELGTARSFVHGGLEGCNSDDRKYWTPDKPENWDWGSGFFTKMAAMSLCGEMKGGVLLHTVDSAKSHIDRCMTMVGLTVTCGDNPDGFVSVSYHHNLSERHLLGCRTWQFGLIYMDTGDMTPIEETAQLHLREAKIIVSRELIMPGGVLLIDDVRNPTPMKFGETSELGKAKYSIPYLLDNGFETVMDEYQVLMVKR